jgi:hypothetical protein
VASVTDRAGDSEELVEGTAAHGQQRLGLVHGERLACVGPRQGPSLQMDGVGHRGESTATRRMRQTIGSPS